MSMNKELLEKLQFQAAAQVNPLLEGGEWQRVYSEKFAELIVGECVQVGGPEDSYTDEWFKAKADSVEKIKQHFGVEE